MIPVITADVEVVNSHFERIEMTCIFDFCQVTPQLRRVLVIFRDKAKTKIAL